METYKQVSTQAIPTGDVTVKILFEADQPTPGTAGHVSLWAGDQLIGEGHMPHTVPIAFTSYAGMDIGRDNGLVVDLDYEDKAPYAFTGTVKEVIFDLNRPTPRPRWPCTPMRRPRPSARAPPDNEHGRGHRKGSMR